jgi:AcrR family transcriptional regulator
MTPRPDVSEERKSQILDAAMDVFARKGFDAARMDDIVDESGLSKGALYWYFESKNEIITAILERFFSEEVRAVGRLAGPQGTARERLTAYLERSIADTRRFLRWMPVAFEVYSLAFRNKVVRSFMRSFLEGYIDALMPTIQAGIDSGEFRPVDVRQAAISIAAIFEGSLLLWVYDPQAVDWEAQVRAGASLLLAGLEAQPD